MYHDSQRYRFFQMQGMKWGSIEMEPPFETVIFTQADEAKNLLMMRELKDAVENQQIRIVDIRRYRDQLIVTFRRLSS